ncbi:hypothetical protein BA184_08420 [Helicobacter pullorum]|uniref:hypothetical protein n=1 Tax=Helicobacter pullorum TaxID=35818 RepID=UPI00081681FB|nr:hypothetical protein [Helicobacter pullorum]OCR03316.1 hypothetical protein BA729_07365 [Helicobacter pullorum]OCR07364.1 hypothetical protein BA185_04565 [Helicobacter pullorum]OCR08629.1 hypothetical protein BA184_08420 [Helicobacter pullorum]OCR10924.1 hypothetical protein BA730_07845 [Helicobacter pullorum]
MPKLDEKKARLEELKVYRNFALTSLLALIGFVFTKINESDTWIAGLCAFAIIVLGISVFFLQKKILKIIKEIGEL